MGIVGIPRPSLVWGYVPWVSAIACHGAVKVVRRGRAETSGSAPKAVQP